MESEYPPGYRAIPSYPEVAVHPADLRLDHADLLSTFGSAEVESAVIALLTPSRDAGRWLAPSWLVVAEQLDWSKADEQENRLDGRFGRLPVAGELSLAGKNLPYGLVLELDGLHSLLRRSLMLIESRGGAGTKIDFLDPQTTLIERLLERQSARR